MTFDPAIHALAVCTVPLNPYPRLAQGDVSPSHSATESAAIPTLTDEDRRRQRVLDEANERRTQVIADARQEYQDNRDVIQKRFSGMTLGQWVDSALRGENLPLLDAAERDKLGGWMK